MNRYVLVIVLLCGTKLFVSGQQGKRDSLKTVFQDIQQSDSSRYEAGKQLVRLQLPVNLDSARATGTRLLSFAKQVGNKSWEASVHKWIGITYAEQGRFSKAHEYFFSSHELFQALDDQPALATSFNNLGTVFYEMGNYARAQEYLLQSLKMAETFNDDNAASRAYNNLGNVHSDLKNNEKALEYYQNSLRLKEKLGYKSRLPAAYNNIGVIHTELRHHELAVQHLEKSAAIAQELEDKRSMTRAFSNLGVEFLRNGDFEQAVHFLNKSVAIKTAIKDVDGLAYALVYRGKVFLELQQFTAARTDCLQAWEMAKTARALNLQKEACDCLRLSYEATGDYRNAYTYTQYYARLKDSLFNKEKTQEITRAEMNYQFEKKQLADSIKYHQLQAAQQVAYERNLNTQHRKFYITLIVSLAVIGLLAFLYWKYRQHLKLEKVENQLLNSEIEFKKKDLTTLAVNISNNQEWAESLAARLESLKAASGRKRQKELELLEVEIKNKIWVDRDSDDFYQKIDALSSAFYDKLNKRFKGLTKTDVRLCSFIKLDLNTKQIATLQNINPASVKMSRNRLRKKLNLSPEQDLTEFLRTF